MNCLTAKRTIPLLLIAFAAVVFSCGPKSPAESMSDDELKKFADELAHRYVIVDGHVDLPWVLYEKNFQPQRDKDTIIHTRRGDFDYERAVLGGLYSPFMSIYVPSEFQKRPDFGKGVADTLIDYVRGITAQLPEKFALANTPAEVAANFASGKISLPMGMENGAPIGNDLKNVEYFRDRGIRYITLTHSKDNQIGDSSGDTTHTWNGLSPFGREVVKEMNRVGIMVDISHVGDSTFYQVMKLSRVPCIASHSSCRHFSPKARRDMTDDMIRKMGENKGVILVNFYNAFLDSAFYAADARNDKAVKMILRERKIKRGDSLATVIADEYDKAHPLPVVDITRVADHIDHIVKLIGIDHVGFGSDFDGVSEMLPAGLYDVSTYPNLIYVLLKRGYSESDIEKIAGGNVIRVWDEVTKAAR